MSSEMSAAIIGAAVATVGVLVVELLLKPAVSRKRVTRVLLSELEINARLLRRIMDHRSDNPGTVSESIQISDRGWQSVAQDLHYLPTKSLNSLILLYNKYEEINQLVRDHSRKGDFVIELGDDPRVPSLMNELVHHARLLDEMLPDVLAHTDRAVRMAKTNVDDGVPDLLPDA